MRVLVSGGGGQLAHAIRCIWKDHELVIPDEASFNLADRASMLGTIQDCQPEVLVNAAAFTQVDGCEKDPELAQRINGDAVQVLAEGCAAVGALLVQVSTDYVFAGNGHRPYREDDPTEPLSAYGKSKLAGERHAQSAPEHLIARTAWLYDAWGRNFFLTMKKAAAEGRSLRVVADQVGSPTTCRALAWQLRVAVEEGWRGLVHMTCAGETSWFGFAQEIFQQTGLPADLSPCTTAEYPLPAPRPAYSVLDGAHRARLGTDVMPRWQDALAEVIRNPILD